MKKLIKLLLLIAFLGSNTLFCNAQQRGDTLLIHRNKRGTISFLRFKPDSTRKMVNAKQKVYIFQIISGNNNYKKKILVSHH